MCLQQRPESRHSAITEQRLQEQVERLREENAELREENEHYERILAMGGYQGDAPPEMLLCGFEPAGCDAWSMLHLHRVDVSGEVPEHYTQPVRYIRADRVLTEAAKTLFTTGDMEES